MLHVLVVEDDEDTAATLSMLLRFSGHDVEAVANGLSALQAVQANRPDVVLLDIAMPMMDGWQVAKQIRQNHDGKRRPLLIAVSGYGTDADRLRSQEVGIDVHLIKPVDPAALEDLLNRFQTMSEGDDKINFFGPDRGMAPSFCWTAPRIRAYVEIVHPDTNTKTRFRCENGFDASACPARDPGADATGLDD